MCHSLFGIFSEDIKKILSYKQIIIQIFFKQSHTNFYITRQKIENFLPQKIGLHKSSRKFLFPGSLPSASASQRSPGQAHQGHEGADKRD